MAAKSKINDNGVILDNPNCDQQSDSTDVYSELYTIVVSKVGLGEICSVTVLACDAEDAMHAAVNQMVKEGVW